MAERADLYRSPEVWGPKVWALLHSGAALATTKPSMGAAWTWRVLRLLGPVLPCEWCQKNLAAHLRQWRRSGVDGEPDVVVWRLHERVNKKVGNPRGPGLAEMIRSRRRRARHYPADLRAAILCLARGWPDQATPQAVRAMVDLLHELMPVAGLRPPPMTVVRTRKQFRAFARSL